MLRMFAILFLTQWQLMPATPTVKPDDPRPPYVTVPMATGESKAIADAQEEVAKRQAELDAAQRKLDDLRLKTIQNHKLKGATEPFPMCGTVDYHGHIDRNFVVWELGVIECRAM